MDLKATARATARPTAAGTAAGNILPTNTTTARPTGMLD